MSQSGFHNKYRPKSLERLIGNKRAVTQLQGIVKSGNYPSAILFTGPPGVGKTTIARCFVNATLESDLVAENLTEVNFGSDRGIDEVRSLIQLARLRPTPGAKRRFIIGDEFHQLASNKPAADAFLVPLEQPVKTTTFLLCSMEVEKFSSTTGKALASRCLQIALEKPSIEDMATQAKRIMKREEIDYLPDETLDALIGQSEFSMRVLANNLELIKGYADGLDKRPKSLTPETLGEAIASAGNNDDTIAARFLIAVYARKYVAAHKELLDVQDPLAFIGKLLFSNTFVLNQIILKGARHPKVWGNSSQWGLFNALKKTEFNELNREQQIAICAEANTAFIALKFGSGAFAVDERVSISGATWTLISKLKTIINQSKD